MGFETIAFSVITALLFLLMLTRKAGKVKFLLGLLAAVCAMVSLVLFVLMQKAAGNPDAGKEFLQLYLPCGVYGVIAVWGAAASGLSHRKLRKEKAARQAAKTAKTANQAEKDS